MVWKAILNSGLVLCLVFQATAPCCCALQPHPERDATRLGHCDNWHTPAPADHPDHCWICLGLGQVLDLPCSSPEPPEHCTLAVWPFQPRPAGARGASAHCGGPNSVAIPLCDIHMIRTLRE